MRRDEVGALGDFLGDAAAGAVTQVQEVHGGIAQRVFGALGPAATPLRIGHDRIAGGTYAAARGLTGALVRGSVAAVALTQPDDGRSLAGSSTGRIAIGVLNGVWGDRLHERRSALELPLALRRDGCDVAVDQASLARAFPDATGRLAVFVHGWGETDDAWRLRASRHAPYGEQLRSELGYTPLYIRYNSGLHISDNGRRFAQLLEQVTANWPVQVAEIALVGHSTGGLLVRSACHYAAPGSWRERVRHVFMLGTPHHGAPLERAVSAVSRAISVLPETRGFAGPLRHRSAGVRDLGRGYVVEEDWRGRDHDTLRPSVGTGIPFLSTANHYFVSATLTRDADAPAGRMLGDLVALPASAWCHGGRGERLRFPVDNYRHLGGASSLDLLNHPAVYEQIRRWLTAQRALAPPQRALPPPPAVTRADRVQRP